jgi:hypothetical protein
VGLFPAKKESRICLAAPEAVRAWCPRVRPFVGLTWGHCRVGEGTRACAVPEGTRFYSAPDPGLPPWAKLFRPARRDWRMGQPDAEQIDKLRANKIPTLAKGRLGWGTRQPAGHPGGVVSPRSPDWAPCLPAKPGSSNNESWSGVSDRIDGWWNQFHRLILNREPWGMSNAREKQNLSTKEKNKTFGRWSCLLTTPTRS